MTAWCFSAHDPKPYKSYPGLFVCQKCASILKLNRFGKYIQARLPKTKAVAGHKTNPDIPSGRMVPRKPNMDEANEWKK